MPLTYLTAFEVCVPCATAQVKIRHSWGVGVGVSHILISIP